MVQLEQIVHRDPEILGGTPVFRGTRVPIRSLFDYLEGGDTLDEFLRQFPSVQREQAIALLDLARETLAAGAPAACTTGRETRHSVKRSTINCEGRTDD